MLGGKFTHEISCSQLVIAKLLVNCNYKLLARGGSQSYILSCNTCTHMSYHHRTLNIGWMQQCVRIWFKDIFGCIMILVIFTLRSNTHTGDQRAHVGLHPDVVDVLLILVRLCRGLN